ncbi:MAG TPA: FG-GAP-like repeat-containing protein, partial [Pirellulales bacterium]|nr:FG-GAP-like repeat-containing protein [Pirellulales bacterium]
SRRPRFASRAPSGLSPTFRGLEPLEERRLLTFAAPVTTALDNVPQCFAVGDFSGDGKVDMAVEIGGLAGQNGPHDPSFRIELFQGNGDGTFQPPVTVYNFGNDSASSLAAADLNHDGKLDLLALVPSSLGTKLDVFFGNGDGTFQSPKTYAVSSATSMALGDVTGDRQTDVVLVGTDSHDAITIQTLLNNGDGTFQSPVTSTLGSFTTSQGYVFEPTSLAIGDFSGDGKLDAVVANYADSRVLVSQGNGDGTFQSPISYTTEAIPAMQQPLIYVGVSALAVGDFNHDGKLDIAASNYAAKSVSVLLGNGDGTFQTSINDSIGAQPYDMVAGDFNGDGNLDLAISDRVSNAVDVLYGNGDGTFQLPANVASVNSPMAMAVADLNQDGLSDLVLTNVGYNSGMPDYYAATTILSTPAPPQPPPSKGSSSQGTTPDESFLARVYQQLLDRAIDPAASAYWNTYLQQGGSRLDVALAIQSSAEYRTDQVELLYQRYLQRNADPAGLQTFVQMLGAGGTLEEVAATLLGSAEYASHLVAQAGQTLDAAFVEALFQDVLGRAATEGDVAAFGAMLAQGVSRGEVAAFVLASAEYRGQLAENWYQVSLGRAVDPGALQFIEQSLANGQTDQQLLAAIVSSDEYAAEIS